MTAGRLTSWTSYRQDEEEADEEEDEGEDEMDMNPLLQKF